MKHGRPTFQDQVWMKKKLEHFYQSGISANAASKISKINVKTVLKYFAEWDKEILQMENYDFLKRVKVEKEKTLQLLDFEIISLNNQEKELEYFKEKAKKVGNVEHFEMLSRLRIKITDQKLKVLSSKIQLINTPTADIIVNLEKNFE